MSGISNTIQIIKQANLILEKIKREDNDSKMFTREEVLKYIDHIFDSYFEDLICLDNLISCSFFLCILLLLIAMFFHFKIRFE